MTTVVANQQTGTIPSIYHPRVGVSIQATLDGAYGPDTIVQTEIIPIATRIQRNQALDPDTFSIEVDKRALPIDPHQVRGIGVEIYIFDAVHLRSEENWLQPKYKRFVGLADMDELDLSEGVAMISGTDYTAIFNQEWDARQKIQQGRGLVETLQRVLDTVQAEVTAKVTVELVAGNDKVLGTGRRARQRRPLSFKPGISVWEVAQRLALREGFTLWIDNEVARLQNVAIVDDGGAGSIPAFAYGRNLESMRVRRRFTRDIVPQVIARGRLPNGTMAEERYPQNPAKARAASGLGVQRDQTESIRVNDATSREDLRNRARLKFQQKARGEAEYEFSTMHMQGLRGLDLLEMRAQKPIQIVWDAFNAENLRQLSVGRRLRYLETLGYSSSVATLIANNMENLAHTAQPYYLTECEFVCDESGFSVFGRAKNYIIQNREGAED